MRVSRLSHPALFLATTLAGCISTSITAPDVHFCLDGCPINSPAFPPPPSSPLPSPVAGGLSFKAISLGSDHVCAVTTAGDAYCWGAVDFGSQGAHVAMLPERVPGGVKFDTISAGHSVTCGIAVDKRAMCWGTNDVGQLGIGVYGPIVSVPTAVLSPVPFKSIAVGGWDVGSSAGNDHSAFACGLAESGTAYCWGSDNLGQLGSGVATPNVMHVAPSPIAGDHSFTALAGNGFATACGLASNGAALCWGSNEFGEFGTATGEAGAFPPTRVASKLTFVTLSTWLATCGITTTGDTYCWGTTSITNGSGLTPKLITSMPFVSLATGPEHACGLTANGTVYCWGWNFSGQLGDGTTNYSAVPVLVATDLRFVRIAAGNEETCALTATGAAYCWGSDGFYSMLGHGR